MPLIVRCSECQSTYALDEGYAGTTVTCGKCGGSMFVPVRPPPESDASRARRSPPWYDNLGRGYLPRLLILLAWLPLSLFVCIYAVVIFAMCQMYLSMTLALVLIPIFAILLYLLARLGTGLGVRWGFRLAKADIRGPVNPRAMGAFALCPALLIFFRIVLCRLSALAANLNLNISLSPNLILICTQVLGVIGAIGSLLLLVAFFRTTLVPALVAWLLGNVGFFCAVATVAAVVYGLVTLYLNSVAPSTSPHPTQHSAPSSIAQPNPRPARIGISQNFARRTLTV